MIPILMDVRSWLEGEGLYAFTEAAADLLVGPFQGHNGQWRLYVWAADRQRILFLSVLPALTPPSRRGAMAALLHRINRRLDSGAFDLDMDSGEVRCRTTSLPLDAEDGTPWLSNALLTNVVAMDRFLPAIEDVLFARRDPVAALAALDQEDAEDPPAPDAGA